MHICKFSYLKGSIRVTLSWWQLKGLLFFCVYQRLMNIPVPVRYETRVQVENCMKNITHTPRHAQTLTAVSATSMGIPFQQKQITCDWDYILVKVALLWYITEFAPFFVSLFFCSLPFIGLKNFTLAQNKEPSSFITYLKHGCSARCVKGPSVLLCNKCRTLISSLFNFFCKAILIW